VALAIVATVVAATALPAGAHASLLSVDPQPGGVYDDAPAAVTLRFTEPVETSLGGVRVFDGAGNRIDSGPPIHPGGRGSEVRSKLPDLDDGTYVVTWRVTSADSHPVEGAFTFQVGAEATAANPRGLAARLLSEQGGSTTVGLLYTLDRGLLFVGLALLIGGSVFVSAVFRPARDTRRGRRIVWFGWALAAIVSVAGIGLEGAYGAALPLSKVFQPSVWGDVLDTRYGKVALLRLALLALAFPLVRIALRPGRTLPRWWPVPAALVGVALAVTPGVGGHASTGDHGGAALVSGTLHVRAKS
jgi:copper transport protein